MKKVIMPFPVRLKTPMQLDPVLLGIGLTLLLGGMIVLASASISVSDNVTGNPFFYLQRQAVAAIIGAAAGIVCLFVPMTLWSKRSRGTAKRQATKSPPETIRTVRG